MSVAINRRRFLQSTACALVMPTVASNYAKAQDAPASKLTATAFQPLQLGAIRPSGWLLRQMRLQADGMGGHLDEFWPDVGANSGWLGGTGESWERGPYFLDGLVPLAWQLDDPVLKAKAMRFIDWTLQHQQADGMIGPTSNDDWWPRMVMVKALAQYADATGDLRVEPVLTRYFHYQLETLPSRPLVEWGKYRWQDEAFVVEWLYDRTSDPRLLKLTNLLQQQGFNWVSSFKDFRHTGPTSRALLDAKSSSGNTPAGMETHGVNNGQAIKTAAVQFRLTGDPAEKVNYDHQVAMLDLYHGQPNGMFSCDEHLAGLGPSQGTELCTVVEAMFSMEVAMVTFGDAKIGDRIERIAYNALPGTFTDDMWAHQYDQQANQISSSLNSKPWTTNGPESNLYGLAPHFGCCTANFHQGWPKLTASLWMRDGSSGGLVATIYAPCEIRTQVAGHEVSLSEETDYPFRNTVKITLKPAVALHFLLQLRVPAWAEGASIRVNGTAFNGAVRPGKFARVDRVWKDGDVVELHLPMVPALHRGFHKSVSVTRGPLVFSLDPGGTWVKLRDRGMTADWQRFPNGPWNYALSVNEHTVALLPVQESTIGAIPFSAANPAVRLTMRARILNAWRSEDGVASPVPEQEQSSTEPEQVLELIPYGSARLRITAFPVLQTERTDV